MERALGPCRWGASQPGLGGWERTAGETEERLGGEDGADGMGPPGQRESGRRGLSGRRTGGALLGRGVGAGAERKMESGRGTKRATRGNQAGALGRAGTKDGPGGEGRERAGPMRGKRVEAGLGRGRGLDWAAGFYWVGSGLGLPFLILILIQTQGK